MPIVLAEIPGFVIGLAVVGFIIVSLMMMLVVLIQKPQGGGLSGAFGAASDGAGQTAFGARTGDALTIATITIFIVFLLISIGLNYIIRPPGVATPPAMQASDAEPSPVQPAGAMPPGRGDRRGDGGSQAPAGGAPSNAP